MKFLTTSVKLVSVCGCAEACVFIDNKVLIWQVCAKTSASLHTMLAPWWKKNYGLLCIFKPSHEIKVQFAMVRNLSLVPVLRCVSAFLHLCSEQVIFLLIAFQ